MSAVTLVRPREPGANGMQTIAPRKPASTGHGVFMAVCCAAMAVGFAMVLFFAPAGQSLASTLLSAVPLLGCLAMHVWMHRFMGRSCHKPDQLMEAKNEERQ
jgi:hypothetical protein